jgi:prephenate dehydrogenase
MGGSLGMALRAYELAERVVGVDRNAEILEEARRRGAIDVGALGFEAALEGADLVVFATHVSSIPALMERCVPFISRKAIVTDLGSVKARIVEAGIQLFGENFIGGHPMAGSERSGVGVARADLFANAAWVWVPSNPLSAGGQESLTRLQAMATTFGARSVVLEANAHDRLVALLSHLPHLLSFSFSHTVREIADLEQARSLAGGSFRDMMRVSAADPSLWRDILHENRTPILEVLAEYERNLTLLKGLLELGTAEDIFRALQHFGGLT